MKIEFKTQDDVGKFIILIITVIGVSVGISSFFFIDYSNDKKDSEIAELKLSRTKLTNELSVKDNQISELEERIATYKAKIDIISNENSKYLIWLESDPVKIPYLENKITELSNEKIALTEIINNLEIPETKAKYEIISKSIKEGQVFIDPFTSVTVGVVDIHVDKSIDIELKLPGNNGQNLSIQNVGKTYEFEQYNKTFELVISEVNYVSDTAIFIVREL